MKSAMVFVFFVCCFLVALFGDNPVGLLYPRKDKKNNPNTPHFLCEKSGASEFSYK
jgi:hypothetical protein